MPAPASAVAFLARRYLRAGRSFVSVITIISILGVAVGVLMMTVVNAVMQGFEREFRQTLIGYQPHMILEKEDEKPATAAEVGALLAKVRQRSEVLRALAFTGGIIYLEKNGEQTGAQLYGLPADGGADYLEKIQPHLLDGTLELKDGIIVANDHNTADLGVRTGDAVSIYPSSSVTVAVRDFRKASDISEEKQRHEAYKAIKLKPLEIQLGGYTRAETAGYSAYTTMATAQTVFGLGQGISGLLVEMHVPNDIKQIHAAFQNDGIIPKGWKAVLWTDVGDARLAAMSNERFVMFFILGIIGLVAAFSVMNTTITVTTQKRREIGVLTALGAEQKQIVGVFVLQAAVVGVVGTLLGLIGSALVITYRNDLRALVALASGNGSMDTEGLFLSTIPAHIDPFFITCTALGSILLCLAAAWPPAWLASRVDPAVALRD